MSIFDVILDIPIAIVTDTVRAVTDPLGKNDDPDDLGTPLVRALIPGASAANAVMKVNND